MAKEEDKHSESDTQDGLQASGEGQENVGGQSDAGSNDSDLSSDDKESKKNTTNKVENVLEDLDSDQKLEVVNEYTGQSYKSLDDAKEGYNQLKQDISGINDLRKKAEEAEYFDKMVQQYATDNDLSTSTARKFLKGAYDEAEESDEKGSNKQEQDESQEDSSSELKEELESLKKGYQEINQERQEKALLEKYPDIQRFIPLIRTVAQEEDKDLVETFEQSESLSELKELVEKEQARDKKEKEEKNVLKNKNRLSPKKSQKLSSMVKKLKKKEAERSKVGSSSGIDSLKTKIVEEALGENLNQS